MQRAKAKSKA
jgi:hypothetical protein